MNELEDDLLPRPGLSRIVRERPLWVLLSGIVLFFARPLFLGQTFFYRDLSLLALAQRVRLVELVRTSGLPLWDPFLHGGQPFLANVSNLALYPTGLLYFVLAPVAAFNLEIVLHFLLCGIAGYVLARVLGLSPVASLITGTVCTFCGFTLSLANLLNRLLAMPNAIFLLLFWHLLLTERRARWFLASVACSVLIILAGSPELLLFTLLTAAGWAFFGPTGPVPLRGRTRALLWAAVAAATAGTAAVQLWPAIEVIRQSIRGTGLDFKAVSGWSMNPRRLFEFVVPAFLGPTDRLSQSAYWGFRLEDLGYPLILSVYFGMPVLALAATEGLSRRNGVLPRRLRRFLLAVAGVSVLAALGRFLLLTPAGLRALRFLDLFRYPVKALTAVVVPLALLAGAAADRLRGAGLPQARGRAAPALAALGAIMLATGTAVATSDSFASNFGRLLFGGGLDAQARSALCAQFLHASLVTLALAWLWSRGAAGTAAPPWILPALATLVALDLLAAGWRVNAFAPRALLEQEPAAAALVRRNAAGGNLFRDRTPADHIWSAPSDEIFWGELWRRQSLDRYLAGGFGIPVIFHDDYDSLAQRRLVRMAAMLFRLPWPRRLPLLSAAGVTQVLSSEDLTPAGLDRAGTIPVTGDAPVFLYRNASAAPRAGFISTWASVDSETDSLKAIVSPGFDPRRHAVIEASPDGRLSAHCTGARVTEREWSAKSHRVEVSAPCDGFLVWTVPFYAGWKSTVDGRATPTLRANFAFSAVAVSNGTHTVSSVYRPDAVTIGALVSLASAAATLAGALRVFRRRGRALPRP